MPVLERARAEEPLLPSVANYLALARLIDGDYSAAFAEIDRGLALEESDIPFLRSGVAIAREASTADPPMKTGLSFWAAYFQEPELALALWTEGTRTPDTLWQPLMRGAQLACVQRRGARARIGGLLERLRLVRLLLSDRRRRLRLPLDLFRARAASAHL